MRSKAYVDGIDAGLDQQLTTLLHLQLDGHHQNQQACSSRCMTATVQDHKSATLAAAATRAAVIVTAWPMRSKCSIHFRISANTASARCSNCCHRLSRQLRSCTFTTCSNREQTMLLYTHTFTARVENREQWAPVLCQVCRSLSLTCAARLPTTGPTIRQTLERARSYECLQTALDPASAQHTRQAARCTCLLPA